MKQIFWMVALSACLVLSIVINLWLFVGRYYVGKADHALLIEMHRTYKGQGCRLPDDIEKKLDTQIKNGFQDLGELNEISMELRRTNGGRER